MMLDPKYTKYSSDVLTGRITACKNIIAACRNYENLLKDPRYDFRPDKCDKVVNFIGNLKHYTGEFSGKPFILEDWQKWVVYNIFGFYKKGSDHRKVTQVILDCARKNGKSMFFAAIGMYMMMGDGEKAAEIDVVANTKDQAKILFKMIQKMSKKIDPRQRYLKLTKNMVEFDYTDSFGQVLASEAASLDGYSSYFFVEDEMHAAKDTALYDVLASSQGARKNPLGCITTTAGYNINGPYFKMRRSAEDVLNGLVEDETLFAALYSLDEGDNYTDKKNWIKANPNMGVSVSEDFIERRVIQAKAKPMMEIDVKIKTFNLWVNAASIWIPYKYITNATQVVNLEDFKGEVCYVGVDLSTVNDMSAWSILFPPNKERKVWPDKYVFKSFVYIPQAALEESPNWQMYQQWLYRGEAFMTAGNAVDYDYILADQIKIMKDLIKMDVGYDTYNATQYVTYAQLEGFNMIPFAQSLGNFNKPCKDFERLVRRGEVIIDNNEVTRFCFNNVEMKIDRHDNYMPDKAGKDRLKKIDIVMSMMMALGVFIQNGPGDISVV